MSEIISYLNYNWAELLLVIGMLLLLRTDVYSDKRMTQNLKVLLLFVLLYSTVNYVEAWFAAQAEFSEWREVLTILNYGVPALIVSRIILLFHRINERILYLPAAVNLFFCASSPFTHWVCWFTADNSFQRGPLNFLPFTIDILYLVYLGYLIVRSGLGNHREDRSILGFMLATALFTVVMPLLPGNQFGRWICTTITLDVVLYYIFLLHQMTKRDTLTHLLNRQTYYADLEKYSGKLTALILVDMNGLKQINDVEGHQAGDTALMTIADCMFRAVSADQRSYRIGGDEFVILCAHEDEEKVKASIEKLRTALGKTKYSCAFGYAMAAADKPADMLYIEADKMMYQDKQKYYESHKRYR